MGIYCDQLDGIYSTFGYFHRKKSVVTELLCTSINMGSNVTPNTVARYKLDSIETINDLSGNGYNLTNMGDVVFGEYQGVDCAKFPGTTLNSMLKNTSLSFQARPQQTVALRFYITGTATDDFQCLYEIGSVNGTGLLGSWYKHSGSPNGLSLSGFTGSTEVIKSGNLINGWHCLMNITNGSSSVQYLDNVLYQSFTNSLTGVQTGIGIGLPLTDNRTSRALKGAISRVVVENIARSETERNNYFNKTKKYFGIA